jgi:hypothetical protein
MNDNELAELYPEGRTFYYEGDDPIAFIKAMEERGLDLTITVRVPADQLGSFYRENWRVGT